MRRLVIGLVSAACALFVSTSVTAAHVDRSVGASAPPSAASVCKGKTLRFIGLAGEEGNKELKGWRNSIGLKLQVTNISNWGQLIGAIKVGQPYDLATFTYSQAQRMIATKIMQPVDVSDLPAWKDFAPALRNSRLIYGPDKKVYGIPLFWGDSPYVYVPSRVSKPPKSILELAKPSWKGRFLVDDDPDILFNLIARAKGYKKSPNLTKSQLKVVEGVAKTIVDNAAAFAASYQDATDRMVAGDADLTVDGWEAQLTWAKEKGKKLAFGFFNEHKGGGWWDGLAIPTTAKNTDCAMAYIAKMMEAKTNALAATNLVSGAANLKAVPHVGKVAKIYDYKIVTKAAGPNDFISFSPPDTASSGFTTEKDWQSAWAAIKAGK
jgi:spermidine/putrescine-binding protein